MHETVEIARYCMMGLTISIAHEKKQEKRSAPIAILMEVEPAIDRVTSSGFADSATEILGRYFTVFPYKYKLHGSFEGSFSGWHFFSIFSSSLTFLRQKKTTVLVILRYK